jgi:hypothetical protein
MLKCVLQGSYARCEPDGNGSGLGPMTAFHIREIQQVGFVTKISYCV